MFFLLSLLISVIACVACYVRYAQFIGHKVIDRIIAVGYGNWFRFNDVDPGGFASAQVTALLLVIHWRNDSLLVRDLETETQIEFCEQAVEEIFDDSNYDEYEFKVSNPPRKKRKIRLKKAASRELLWQPSPA